MKATDWNMPRRKKIISEICRIRSPYLHEEIKTPHFHLMENNAVLALGSRKCMIGSRRLSAKNDREGGPHGMTKFVNSL